jgi:hypothetical protein
MNYLQPVWVGCRKFIRNAACTIRAVVVNHQNL